MARAVAHPVATARRGSLRLGLRLLLGLVVLAVWAFYLFPLVWLMMMSLKTRVDAFAYPPLFLFTPTFDYYLKHLTDPRFMATARNSAIVTALSVAASMALGSLAAYSLARFRFKHATGFALGLIIGRMIPPIVFVVPIFLLFNVVGLRNTYWGLALVYTTFNLPFVVWMMRSFFEDVPIELEQAAMIDGASRLRAFWTITVPLASPGLAATAVFCALLAWSEFLFALILSGPATRTLPIQLASYITERTIEWGDVTSAGVMVVVPLVGFALLVQRHLIKGLTLGAMKG